MNPLHHFFKGTSRFFTLIELLVVISIISTLASATIVNVNTARSKAANSRLKESLSSLRNQAQLYYTTNGTYGTQATSTGLSSCTSGVFGDPKMQQIIASAQGDGIGPVTCVATNEYYTISVPLKSDDSKSWCVDSLGYAGSITGTVANNVCSASASASPGSVGCAATGGCPFTMSGSSCTSYSATSSPSTCDYVSQTSTCTDGAWDGLPFDYPTCDPACVSSGGCPVTAEGGTCVSYSSATPISTCVSVAATSTCTSASWDVTPSPYSTCTEGCPASGGCVASADGATCTTYTAPSVTSPTTCESIAVTSTCSGGVWDVAPTSNAACSVVTNPAGAGGTVTIDGDYKVHKFTGSGTFTVTTPGSFDVLVVGGGGGGGKDSSWYGPGGGGGGGVAYGTVDFPTAGNYNVTIGAGGAGATFSPGSNGGNTTLFKADGSPWVVAAGGGGGAGQRAGGVAGSNSSAGVGGSGGGGAGNGGSAYAGGASGSNVAVAGFSLYHNNGGTGNYGGPGGSSGFSSSISGTNTSYGVGAPGGFVGGTVVANSGNGGGGGANNYTNGVAGAAGVVIVRYKYQ